jgi:hypothetical protein
MLKDIGISRWEIEWIVNFNIPQIASRSAVAAPCAFPAAFGS